MAHIHVEAHADGVGRDKVVHLSRLVHADLGVSRARAERAQHHGGAAPLPADELRQAINLASGEGDHGGARRQARNLAVAGVVEPREAGPFFDNRLRRQLPQQRPDRLRTEEHRLVPAPRMQKAVGDDMAALGIRRHLHLVHGEEGDGPVKRHGLGGADEIARPGRDQLFFACYQRHRAGALDGNDTVVVLPREQTERETDHAGLVREHALHGGIGLAGIGRP